ncbi:thymidine kinase [Candidatus Paracaedibacter symbiosus]|uniref:thymidine kinase n=1 Tax=Candidatus Paracaedibacter symbiosus TaxID=244582 RepID=UPI000509E890|nr:thymidine kinase [Candidatus Paracaedibacter symbiosus]
MAKLFFYYSAMNAGKTTTLLQSSHNYRERGMNTLAFTPDFDDRYGIGKISSRIGLQSNAYAFATNFNFFDHIAHQKKILPNLKCILVDEAQFLTRSQVQQLCQIVDQLDLPVLCYGLRTDFLGELFEGSRYLLGQADELIELKTICHCGRKAIMNARINETGQMVREGAQVEIGGNDRYISLCRKHFFLGHSQPQDKCILELIAV